MATVYNNEFKLSVPASRERHSLSCVTLSCHLQPEISAVDMEIRWFKRTRCVCLYKNRQMIEGKGFIGRMSLFTQALDKGRVSLQLRNCSWSDLGEYLCQVISGDRVEELTVTAEIYIDSPTQAHFGSPVYIRQTNREWTDEERIMMEGNVLLTEYKTDVKSLMNQLEEKYSKLDLLEEQLQNTKLELDSASKAPDTKDQQKEDMKKQLEVKNTELKNKEKTIKEKNALLNDVSAKLENTTKLLDREKALNEKVIDSQIHQSQIDEMKKYLKQKDKELKDKLKLLTEKDAQLTNLNEVLTKTVKEMESLGKKVSPDNPLLQDIKSLLELLKTDLSKENQQLTDPEFATDRGTKSKDWQLQNTEGTGAIHLIWLNIEMPVSESVQDPAKRDRSNSTDGDRPNLSGKIFRPVNPVPGPGSELRLVLLGRTGSGKTSAGYIILKTGRLSQAGPIVPTQQSMSTQAEVAGRKLTLVDTLDWFSPGLSLEQLRQDVRVCVTLSSPGPHVFLLVLPAEKITAEEKGMLEKIEMLFGETCWQNMMIIFTITDELQKNNIEEFIQSVNPEVRRLVEKCRGMTHCLNITKSGNDSQVVDLLEKIENLVDGNKKKFYSSRIYLETESQIRAIETKILKQEEEKEKELPETLRNIENVIQEHDEALRQLNDRTTELEIKMKEEKDEKKKKELERELLHEVQGKMDMEERVKRMKEERDKQRSEIEPRHQHEIEKVSRIAAESNIMQIILPELQRSITSKVMMQEDFNRQMEEKKKELESLKQELSKRKDD